MWGDSVVVAVVVGTESGGERGSAAELASVDLLFAVCDDRWWVKDPEFQLLDLSGATIAPLAS